MLRLAREHEVLITIEEGSIGGFGAYVLQALAEDGALDRGGLKVRMMVLPDTFIDQDSPNAMYAKAGLDAKGIVAKVFEALGRDAKVEVDPAGVNSLSLIPAKAGIQHFFALRLWVPAFAGTSGTSLPPEAELLESRHVRCGAAERDRLLRARHLDCQRRPAFQKREDARVRRSGHLDADRAVALARDRVAGEVETWRSRP